NCPLAISTRKPRTPRKRPNQTYNEAAAILFTAYPKIFPTKANPCKFTKSHGGNEKNPFLFETSDLLMPFRVMDDGSEYLLHPPPPKGFNLVEKGNSTSEIWRSSPTLPSDRRRREFRSSLKSSPIE
ncbi:hypothetical protein MIMGU_mgv1a023217mg, partial [Erythranthe guttata]